MTNSRALHGVVRDCASVRFCGLAVWLAPAKQHFSETQCLDPPQRSSSYPGPCLHPRPSLLRDTARTSHVRAWRRSGGTCARGARGGVQVEGHLDQWSQGGEKYTSRACWGSLRARSRSRSTRSWPWAPRRARMACSESQFSLLPRGFRSRLGIGCARRASCVFQCYLSGGRNWGS